MSRELEQSLGKLGIELEPDLQRRIAQDPKLDTRLTFQSEALGLLSLGGVPGLNGIMAQAWNGSQKDGDGGCSVGGMLSALIKAGFKTAAAELPPITDPYPPGNRQP